MYLVKRKSKRTFVLHSTLRSYTQSSLSGLDKYTNKCKCGHQCCQPSISGSPSYGCTLLSPASEGRPPNLLWPMKLEPHVLSKQKLRSLNNWLCSSSPYDSDRQCSRQWQLSPPGWLPEQERSSRWLLRTRVKSHLLFKARGLGVVCYRSWTQVYPV